MTFALPDLPFAKEALGEIMSAETLDFHHGKHHRAYVDATNKLVADTDLADRRLTEVVMAARERNDAGLFNQAAQLWNHSFFWQCLAPPSRRRPTGRLGAMIDDAFGSTDALLARLKEEATGHFSNGWAWLALDRDELRIVSLHDADTPIVHEGLQPLLTLDLWEHAYYIDYRNDRGGYAEAVLGGLIDWEFVAENLDGKGVSRADQEPG